VGDASLGPPSWPTIIAGDLPEQSTKVDRYGGGDDFGRLRSGHFPTLSNAVSANGIAAPEATRFSEVTKVSAASTSGYIRVDLGLYHAESRIERSPERYLDERMPWSLLPAASVPSSTGRFADAHSLRSTQTTQIRDHVIQSRTGSHQ
jgi:hypothetical protein